MIRIAVYSRAQRGIGGSFQYGLSLLQALARLDPEQYEVRFWYQSEEWRPFLQRLWFAESAFPQPNFTYGPIRGALRLGNKILRSAALREWLETDPVFCEIARWRPAVCISLEQSFSRLPPGINIIGPIHDLMHRYEARFPEVGEAAVYVDRERLYTGHCANASAILVDSEIGRQHVLECYAPRPEKIFILPFAAPPECAEPQKPEAFPLEEGQPYLFYPAQLWLHKNHSNLLKAVALLRHELKIDCIFTGTTDKSGLAQYGQTLRELGLHTQVHHLGYVDDAAVAWLFRHARCMIMPTFFGPTNIPPLEAMRAGCPVAVSDVYGMTAQLGDAALYFDPKDPQDIARCIRALWTDAELCAALRQKGFMQAARWTEEDFERRFLQILHKVLEK